MSPESLEIVEVVETFDAEERRWLRDAVLRIADVYSTQRRDEPRRAPVLRVVREGGE